MWSCVALQFMKYVFRKICVRIAPIILVGLTLLFFLGGGSRYTTRKLNHFDITGTWKLTDQSRQMLKRKGHTERPGESYSITFSENGSFAFASVMATASGQVGSYQVVGGDWTL